VTGFDDDGDDDSCGEAGMKRPGRGNSLGKVEATSGFEPLNRGFAVWLWASGGVRRRSI
jgi:hypothetical protein